MHRSRSCTIAFACGWLLLGGALAQAQNEPFRVPLASEGQGWCYLATAEANPACKPPANLGFDWFNTKKNPAIVGGCRTACEECCELSDLESTTVALVETSCHCVLAGGQPLLCTSQLILDQLEAADFHAGSVDRETLEQLETILHIIGFANAYISKFTDILPELAGSGELSQEELAKFVYETVAGQPLHALDSFGGLCEAIAQDGFEEGFRDNCHRDCADHYRHVRQRRSHRLVPLQQDPIWFFDLWGDGGGGLPGWHHFPGGGGSVTVDDGTVTAIDCDGDGVPETAGPPCTHVDTSDEHMTALDCNDDGVPDPLGCP